MRKWENKIWYEASWLGCDKEADVSSVNLSSQETEKKDFALDATGRRKVDDNDNDNNNKSLSIISTYNILQTFFGLFQSCTQGL